MKFYIFQVKWNCNVRVMWWKENDKLSLALELCNLNQLLQVIQRTVKIRKGRTQCWKTHYWIDPIKIHHAISLQPEIVLRNVESLGEAIIRKNIFTRTHHSPH